MPAAQREDEPRTRSRADVRSGLGADATGLTAGGEEMARDSRKPEAKARITGSMEQTTTRCRPTAGGDRLQPKQEAAPCAYSTTDRFSAEDLPFCPV